jgi:GNAT superfamily N-acetyltransferase
MFEIRPATWGDLRLLLEHRLAMLADVFMSEARAEPVADMEAPTRAWLERHFGRDFEAWLAWRSNEVAGSAAVIWFDHPPTPVNPRGLEAYILNVYTSPLWRRRGVARALTERIVAEARRRGVCRIWLRTSRAGEPLYRQMGFDDSNYLQLRND